MPGALSPDGELVAGGGWTGDEWDGNFSIYLFNRTTGKLVRRLMGLENVIYHLCFSPDGRYLAATLFGKCGPLPPIRANFSWEQSGLCISLMPKGNNAGMSLLQGSFGELTSLVMGKKG